MTSEPTQSQESTRGAQAGELLYNGIQLPSIWPPKDRKLTLEPPDKPPYLANPPAVIPIDVGRQLLVDDFLIEETNLSRIFHAAEYYPQNPLLKPDKPWELKGSSPAAMVFSDGVFFDPADNLFKMWYAAGESLWPAGIPYTCYATSRDGIHWRKPSLDVAPGTNVVLALQRNSSTVWLDLAEKDPARRFKMFEVKAPEMNSISIYVSPDGIHWIDTGVRSGNCGDRSTVFYNSFRKVWVYSLRGGHRELGRIRNYRENPDAMAGANWKLEDLTPWAAADRLDPPRASIGSQPELYNVDAVAYESLMLGLFSIWRGHPEDRLKVNEVLFVFSRDGFHWDRPWRSPFVTVSERYGDWNWGDVQSAGGCCVVVGDKLYFYVSGRAGVRGSKDSGVSSTGLAVLRRDGFASMEIANREGTLTTRPVRFSGKHLFVNADSYAGELRVEVLDEKGQLIAHYSREDCIPIRANSTLQRVRWKDAEDLSALAGKPVKFRFYVKDGGLYAFWVSRDRSGASNGYVAAGGPGFKGPTDTVGSAAYRSASKVGSARR